MRLVTHCLVVALVAFTVQQAAGQQLTIIDPDPGDATVTVTGYVVPESADGAKDLPQDFGLLPADGKGIGATFYLWLVAVIIIIYVFLVPQKDGTAAYETQVIEYWTTNDQLTVDLPQQWAAGSSMVAVESHRGLWAAVHEPSAKDSGLGDPSFELTGFHEGSTSITISGLPVGAEVSSSLVTPGVAHTRTWLEDGWFTDDDGVANGTIVSRIPRWEGPPHALSGEILTLAVEGESGGEIGVWTCSGTGARLAVPVVSHIIGSSGIPFISDLDLSNPFGLDVSGWVRFVPDGASWDSGTQTSFSLDPFESATWTDVLQSALGITDNVKGTLFVGGFPHWNLAATSRNYAVDADNRQFGIAVPGIKTVRALGAGNLWIIPGLRQTSQVRSNLVLAGAVPQTSSVTVRLMIDGEVAGSDDLQVPGFGLKQVNRVAESLGVPTVDEGYLELEVTSGAVFAGLSVVDGSADDAAFVTARPLTGW